MEATGHTPGPWIVTKASYPSDEITVRPVGHYAVASVFSQRHSDGSPEYDAEANADLIAAAPDLLALMEQVEWGDRDHWPFCLFCGCYRGVGHKLDCKLAAVLAKVHGKEVE